MIGRHRELASIGHLLERAAAGVGGCLCVVGPPGAGKTAVTDAAAAAARDLGLPVFRWAGTGTSSGQPWRRSCAGPPAWAGGRGGTATRRNAPGSTPPGR